MEKTHHIPPQRKDKKLVDLIYLDKYKESTDLRPAYQTKLDFWLEWMNEKLDRAASENLDNNEQNEYFTINHYLRHFLLKRFQWILETANNKKLQQRYILVLPPFNQQGGIKSFLLHFFQLKESAHRQDLEFCGLNDSEKEIRILWDMYKLVKTIETVTVLKKSIAGPNPFHSQFSPGYIGKTLETVEKMLNLLIQICVKPEHFKDLRYHFPLGVFEPEPILSRKENNNFLINSIAIEKFDYRNYFFHFYYKPSLMAKHRGKDLTFKYNFLDFEIMRQEFLICWLNSRLKNNPKKMQVFENYMVGKRTFKEIIQQSPEQEIQLLKKLPNNVFNDLVAHVNEAVDPEDKTELNPLSQNVGIYAEQLKVFAKAKELSRKTTQALQEFVGSLKQSISQTVSAVLPSTKGKASPIKEEKPELDASSFQTKLLKMEEIDFPFFHPDPIKYENQLDLFESSMSQDQLQSVNQKIMNLVNSAKKNSLLSRPFPRKERSLPILLKEKTSFGTSMQILILGVTTVEEQDDAGSTDKKEKAFFVYGSKIRNFEMGETGEPRNIMDKEFYVYHPPSPEAVKKALLLLDVVIADKSLFTG